MFDTAIRTESVRDDGLVGSFFVPSTPPPFPVVVAVGGSSPGIFGIPGVPLASHGVAVLALAYFGMPSLPRDLAGVPLEYFRTALRWLQRRPDVRHDAIAVAGASRGGELALLLASEYPEIKAVVSWVGSGIAYGGLVRDSRTPVAAWTRGSVDVPFAPFDATVVDWTATPVRLTPGFVAGLGDTAAVAAAEIPVERINGPVLLISGGDDQVWPSTRLSAIAVARLRAHHHPFAVEHLAYEQAGHLIGPPVSFLSFSMTHAVHPVLGVDFAFGGSGDANTHASHDSWGRILAFLDHALAVGA